MPKPIKFSDNKYTKTYYQIIDRARERKRIHGQIEKHHIIPKCIGGSNRVKLYFKEHLVCHHLLIKMVPRELCPKMIDAYFGVVGRPDSFLEGRIKKIRKTMKKTRKSLTSRSKCEILNL